MIKNKDELKKYLNNIECAYKELDFITDPAIEDMWVCVNDCCANVDIEVFDIFEQPSGTLQDLLGEEGLRLTYQLGQYIKQIIWQIDYEFEKGFSKTEQWNQSVSHMNIIKLFLQNVLMKHNAFK